MNSDCLYKSGEYLSNNPDWHERDGAWKAKQIVLMMERNLVKPETIAEIGSGSGRILHELAQQYPAVRYLHGYDISPDAMAIARKYEIEGRIAFYQEDLLKHPPSRRYHLLLSIDVFEHVDDYLGFLRKLHCLADRFIFHVPLDMHIQGLIRDLQIDRRNRFGHLHYFSKATALRTIEDAGYRLIDYFYTPGKLEGPSARTNLGDYIMNIPRRLVFPLFPDLTVKLFGGYSLLVLAEPCKSD